MDGACQAEDEGRCQRTADPWGENGASGRKREGDGQTSPIAAPCAASKRGGGTGEKIDCACEEKALDANSESDYRYCGISGPEPANDRGNQREKAMDMESPTGAGQPDRREGAAENEQREKPAGTRSGRGHCPKDDMRTAQEGAEAVGSHREARMAENAGQGKPTGTRSGRGHCPHGRACRGCPYASRSALERYRALYGDGEGVPERQAPRDPVHYGRAEPVIGALAGVLGSRYAALVALELATGTQPDRTKKETWTLIEGARAQLKELVDASPETYGAQCRAKEAGRVAAKVVSGGHRSGRVDRILTSKRFGIPIMIAFLALILWITIAGTNVPSAYLAQAFEALKGWLQPVLLNLGMSAFFVGLIVDGMVGTLGWVVSVMLPPMAIFFPLFTLLEDLGVLPRIAFNLDGYFQRAKACGKQALTMCMGLGCNAVGVVGCRIIDSERERMIAILTNNFMPCNGRFPILIAISAVFFGGALGSAAGAAAVLAAVLLGVFATLAVSRILSGTLLKGMPSAFTLELPPYRKPQIAKVLVRSVLDRTLFVLGRAAAVAAPAGILIFLLANIEVGEGSLLSAFTAFLDPAGRLMGLDGVILAAFILGIPANETVIPIMLMAYLATGTLTEAGSMAELAAILKGQGWTMVTAVNVMILTIMHFPCATTLWTIKKETGSLKWTALAFLLPTLTGVILCVLIHGLAGLWPLVFG
ncbi:ferrous iron transporter B [Christensenellaceae bacterium NSJ-53]|uniref:Ferrous iron transporter B n=2 Tax=Gehongia tenuis TaxID=2763655 RepID=A0A926D392_9FIRM|nr:ferrous iron transporter B [Gehongia tenuis]